MASDDHQHLAHSPDHYQRHEQQNDPEALQCKKRRFINPDRKAEEDDHHRDAGFAPEENAAQGAHTAAPAARPLRGTAACMMDSWVASPRLRSAVSRPSDITSTRSHRAISSGSSEEISRIARPCAASSPIIS